jgi:hypothetical protein
MRCKFPIHSDRFPFISTRIEAQGARGVRLHQLVCSGMFATRAQAACMKTVEAKSLAGAETPPI